MKETRWCIALLLAICVSNAAVAQRGSARHEVAKPIPAPPCSSAGTKCFPDTTRSGSTECCMSSGVADWLILPRGQDSLEFFATVSGGSASVPLVTMMQIGRSQSWQEHLPGLTAPFLRHRFSAGAYRLTVDLDGEPRAGLPYTLTVRQAGDSVFDWAPPAQLRLVGTLRARWLVRPAEQTLANDDQSFVVPPGTYKVLAHGNSVAVCRFPCRGEPKIITLRPSQPSAVR